MKSNNARYVLVEEGTFNVLAHFSNGDGPLTEDQPGPWQQAVRYFRSLDLPGGLRGKVMWMAVGEGREWWKDE